MNETIYNQRTASFVNNPNLDEIIRQLKILLFPLQTKIKKRYQNTKWPVSLIVGVPRSGTTFLLQTIAATGAFSYPSNLINRFAYLPYIGSLVQRILFDPACDYQDEFSDLKSEISYNSYLGVSRGALATSEFQHFFRNFIKEQNDGYIKEKFLKEVDIKGIISGLASIEDVFKKPFICKGVLLQNNIEYFSEALPNTIYIAVERATLYNMQSLYIARKEYSGSENIWWSIRPKEYQRLKKLNPYEQIAGQVFFLKKAIERGFNNLEESRKIRLFYDDICVNPKMVYETVKEKYCSLGYNLKWPEIEKWRQFDPNRKIILTNDKIEKLLYAYEKFKDNDR